MVAPTWMSLICASVKPCSAGASPTIGTSTRTTAAVRRAFQKPHTVTASASSGTACALVAVQAGTSAPCKPRPTAHNTIRLASRSSVSTSRDENRPMNNRPAQVSSTVRSDRRP